MRIVLSRMIPQASFLSTLAVAFVAASLAIAQDPTEDGTTDDTPDVVPQQESVAIEPYKGPPIYLPEPTEPPPAQRVESKEHIDYYDPETKKQPYVVRNVVRFSDDSIKSDGDYREYYPDGKVFVEGQYRLGAPAGEWKYYHPDGTTVAKVVNYEDGQPEGAVDVYRADGTLKAKRAYANGRRQGEWTVYGDDGKQKLFESHYTEGKADGVWQAWYDNGQQRTQIPFVDGKREGTAIEWDDEGNKRSESSFKEGLLEGVMHVWTKDGREFERQYEGGKMVSSKELKK
ncbi:toxin-antitoxin system YwqK family antitoxin [Aeoliella sp.]|uniref:toxin-antitoxin system YwqK family antitoxin n=1 Tax=Aeoliella sp. TaxID=2795800 RepID=UPI003CCBDE6F